MVPANRDQSAASGHDFTGSAMVPCTVQPTVLLHWSAPPPWAPDRQAYPPHRSGGFLYGMENLPAFDEHATKQRVPFAIWVTLWAIIVLAALALIISVVAWFAIP